MTDRVVIISLKGIDDFMNVSFNVYDNASD